MRLQEIQNRVERRTATHITEVPPRPAKARISLLCYPLDILHRSFNLNLTFRTRLSRKLPGSLSNNRGEMHSILTILVASLLVSTTPDLTLNVETTAIPHATSLSISEPDALDLYIERLVFAESSGREDVVIIDTNGKKSYGCLQFQEETFRRYAKKFGVTSDILDCAGQRYLAHEILRTDPRGWVHWQTSVGKLGRLPPGGRPR